MSKYCSNCGGQINDDAKACVHCGTLVEEVSANASFEEKKYCTHCGKAIPVSATTCSFCGVPCTVNSKGVVRVVEDKNSFGLGFLGFLIPIVGLILFLSWRKETPLKAKSAGIGALVGFILYVVATVAWCIFLFVIGSSGAEASGVFTALTLAISSLPLL